jgi:8-oxo-dGTP diphosphatase
MSTERSTVIPCAALLLRRDDTILLARRFNTGYQDGKLSLVSGHIENNETPTAAIIREAKEEVGISLHEADLKLVHAAHQICDDSDRLNLYFETENWEGQVSNTEPEKCSELLWVKLVELPSDIVPYIASVIGAIANNQIYSEYEGSV